MTACTLEPPPSKKTALLDHLSFSSIKTYQSCPRKFAFKYIEQVPEEFTPSAFVFGGAFHRAAEKVHDAILSGENIPEVEALVSAFDSAWNELVSNKAEIKFSKDENLDTLRILAARMLSAFRGHIVETCNSGSQIIGIEHAVRFRLLADAPPIEMRLDLLELRDGDLIVSDWKTSRSRWNDTKVAEGLPQLVLYAHGLLPLLREVGATRIVPRFVVITKAKKAVVQVLQPTATKDDATRLKLTVGETWSAIQSGVFPRREKSWACTLCPFRQRCLGC